MLCHALIFFCFLPCHPFMPSISLCVFRFSKVGARSKPGARPCQKSEIVFSSKASILFEVYFKGSKAYKISSKKGLVLLAAEEPLLMLMPPIWVYSSFFSLIFHAYFTVYWLWIIPVWYHSVFWVPLYTLTAIVGFGLIKSYLCTCLLPVLTTR